MSVLKKAFDSVRSLAAVTVAGEMAQAAIRHRDVASLKHAWNSVQPRDRQQFVDTYYPLQLRNAIAMNNVDALNALLDLHSDPDVKINSFIPGPVSGILAGQETPFQFALRARTQDAALALLARAETRVNLTPSVIDGHPERYMPSDLELAEVYEATRVIPVLAARGAQAAIDGNGIENCRPVFPVNPTGPRLF